MVHSQAKAAARAAAPQKAQGEAISVQVSDHIHHDAVPCELEGQKLGTWYKADGVELFVSCRDDEHVVYLGDNPPIPLEDLLSAIPALLAVVREAKL